MDKPKCIYFHHNGMVTATDDSGRVIPEFTSNIIQTYLQNKYEQGLITGEEDIHIVAVEGGVIKANRFAYLQPKT